MYPKLQESDFRQDIQRLGVPVDSVPGVHEARAQPLLAEEWFERLEAPRTELIVFEHLAIKPSSICPPDSPR